VPSKSLDAPVVGSDAFLCVPYFRVCSSELDEFLVKAELSYSSAAEQVPNGSSCQLVHSLRAAQYSPDGLQEPAESQVVPQCFRTGSLVRAYLSAQRLAWQKRDPGGSH
jgi:hypothetical protein